MTYRSAIAFAFAIGTIIGSVEVAAAGDTTLRRIWGVLDRRQSEAATVKVDWTSRAVVPAFHRRLARAGGGADTDDKGDMEVPGHPCLLILSGDRVRYESQIASFRGERDGEPVPNTSAFDGNRQQSLTEGGDEGESFSQLAISTSGTMRSCSA